jgi:hypothetical protein
MHFRVTALKWHQRVRKYISDPDFPTRISSYSATLIPPSITIIWPVT